MTPNERQTVLDSLTQFGGALTMSEAAAKYGVTKGTIGYWAKERRDGKKGGEVVKLATAPPLPASRVEPAATKVALVRGRVAAAAIGPELRADFRAVVADSLGYARRLAAMANAGPPPDLTDSEKQDWRPPDMRQLKALTGSLADLLGAGADILAFDERTSAPAGDAPTDLTTPDGEAAVTAQLAALPRHLLERALKARSA